METIQGTGFRALGLWDPIQMAILKMAKIYLVVILTTVSKYGKMILQVRYFGTGPEIEGLPQNWHKWSIKNINPKTKHSFSGESLKTIIDCIEFDFFHGI